MSENLSKTSSKSKVYEKNLKLFRLEISKLNKKLEEKIDDRLQEISFQADDFMAKLSETLDDK